jgi:hypothetical protein
MYRIKQLFERIRHLIHWVPIIWRDRDWDYYFIYEILKHKLISTERYIREKGIHMYNNQDADNILKAIEMIEKVQTEYHLDKYMSAAPKWTKAGINKSMKDHNKARKELFQYLNDNIEKWWD